MSSGNFDLTTYYAKRIIGDAAAATAENALLQTGDGITSNTWILHRTNRTTKKYGIHYAYDGTNGHDTIEFYGKETNDDATAWIQLDTGDASFNSILGKVEITNIDIPNTATSYYFPYVGSSSSGVQALLTSGRIYLYEGTNRTHICIGNSTRQGGITLWGSGGNYTDIITEAATSNKTVHIPNYSGWIAVGGDGSSTGVGNSYRPVYLSASGQLTTTTSYFVNGSTNSHQLGGFSVVVASTTHTNVADYASHRITLMTTDDGLLLWDNDQSAEIWSWRKNSSGIWQGSITGNAVTATRANITTTKYGIAYYSNTTGTFASTTYGAAGQVLIGKGNNDAPDWYGGLTLTGTQASDWKVTINGTSASSSTDTGALVVSGGVGVAGKLYVNSEIWTNTSLKVRPNSRYKNIYFIQNGTTNIAGRIEYDSGDATNITSGKFHFVQYSPNDPNDTGTNGKYEYYYLPVVPKGLSANQSYAIFTEKNDYTNTQKSNFRIAIGIDSSADYQYKFLMSDGTNDPVWRAAFNISSGDTIPELADESDLDEITDPSIYCVRSSTHMKTILNNPQGENASSGGRIVTMGGYTATADAYQWQFVFMSGGAPIFRNRSSNTSWNSWRTFVTHPTCEAIGDTTTPVYVNANGFIQKCTVGAEGYPLVGTGTNSSPIWYSGLTATGTQASDWVVSIKGTTAINTSNYTTGALVVSGGASFASAIVVNGWVRTFGDNGWYSQTHGGGLCMRDDSYVRMYGQKQFLITTNKTASNDTAASNNNLSSQLIISSLAHSTTEAALSTTAGGTVAIELWRGSNASWQISNNAGTLYFKNNWTTALQSTYTQTAMSIAYNTGNTTISGELTVNNLIKSTYNSNTVTIGSQNANWCHIYNSADVPFIFNKSVQVVGKANLGGTSYPWGNLYIGGNDNGIYFVGTKNNYRMIRFIDAGDIYGSGISIGGGGVTILGSGESSDTLITNLAPAGGTETTYIASDNSIEFYPSQNGYDASARIWMTASVLNIGVDGNTTRESSVNVYSGAGRIQLYSAASATGNRGLWVAAHGTGAAKTVITVDTNNNVTLNGNAATATRIDGNLTAATSDVNRNIWVSSGAGADGIPNYISGFNMNPSTKVFTVPAGTRISPSAGALYLGNSGNQSWVYVQDICSQDEQKWKIHQSGNAEFTGTVTAPTFSGNASSADSLSGGLVTNTVTSYGNLAVTTAKGSYYGINFGHNASGMSIMSINASHQGLYNQTNGQWIIYYNAASTSKSISIGSSTVNVTGGISLNLNTYLSGTLTMTGNQTITGAGAHWTKWQNTTTGVIISMWSDTTNQGIYSYSYWNGSANASGAGWILYRGTDSYVHTSFRLYGAVWNDYAEYRECDKLTPGTCVQEHNNGHLTQSDRRLIPGASIISDTFGFAEGQTEKADTPIAVSGRVLAYTYRNRYEYHAGQAVCSAPDGTVDIMSRDEIMMYPDAIVGIVSEIPEYEEWGTDHIKVNNRIWIKVK